MNQVSGIHVQSDFQVKIVKSDKKLSEKTSNEVEKIWREEKQKRGKHLFNGKILSMISLDGSTLVGEFIDYKLLVAQLQNPALAEEINALPVGVSGITMASAHYLLGKRSEFVTMHPGYYELAPSGSVSEEVMVGEVVNLKKQIFLELQEEIGIPSECVTKITPFALVKDLDKRYVEVCFKIEVKQDVLAGVNFSKDEYQEAAWFTRSEIIAHMREHKNDYVPVSLYIFNQIL
ncbi:MAG: hypothetical protein VX777_10785 [Chlamydiota bacterium]|nr:hypothetical protein [Chlamydiota bacterium]